MHRTEWRVFGLVLVLMGILGVPDAGHAKKRKLTVELGLGPWVSVSPTISDPRPLMLSGGAAFDVDFRWSARWSFHFAAMAGVGGSLATGTACDPATGLCGPTLTPQFLFSLITDFQLRWHIVRWFAMGVGGFVGSAVTPANPTPGAFWGGPSLSPLIFRIAKRHELDLWVGLVFQPDWIQPIRAVRHVIGYTYYF